MRFVISPWCLGVALLAMACDANTNGVPGPQNGSCPSGQQMCDGQCVAGSDCPSTGVGGTSTSSSTASGGTTTVANGGFTTVANGGKSQSTGAGGSTVAAGGTTSGTTAPTGGKAATGGTSATGGSSFVDDPTVCNDTATIKTTMTAQYAKAYISTNNPNKNYVAITNWWHKFTDQKVALNGLGFTVTNTTSSPDDAPVGFPTIFIGTYQDNATVGSNLPKQISAITSAPTVFDTNATSLDTSNFNATYDIWLTANNTPLSSPTVSSPGSGGAYVMVWLYKPSNRQPRGAIRASGQTVGKTSGTWNVWADTTNPPCISYVASSPISALSFDLKDFLMDSTKYGVKESMYLSIVFAGFEIWSGGNNATINKFCAKVN